MNGLGHQVVQEPKPFSRHLLGENIDAGYIATAPALHRVRPAGLP